MIRLTGMSSGLDTESMITELMSAYSKQKQKKVSTMTKYSWKMDAWKSLNTKIYSFYTKNVSDMRFSSSYTAKKCSVSDSTKASVIASNSAVNGSQTLAVKQLAQSGYLTGGKIKTANGLNASSDASLKALGYTGGKASFDIKVGDTTKKIEVDNDTKISDVVKKLQDAGVNASFDKENQRFFISAKTSGKDADFSFAANDTNAINAMKSLGIYTPDDVAADSALAKSASYLNYKDASGNTQTITATKYADMTDAEKKAYQSNLKSALTDEVAKQIADITQKYNDAQKIITEGPGSHTQEELDAAQKVIDDNAKYIEAGTGNPTDALTDKVAEEFFNKSVAAKKTISDSNNGTGSEAVRIKGQDAEIYLNGAFFSSKTNDFNINGLTITATGITGLNEDAKAAGKTNETATAKDYNTITLTTETNTDAVYESIKNFITQYNDLMKEMETKYNADSDKGYDVLSAEEKDALSDTEAEEWDKKIKDALLRRDSTLNTVMSSLKSSMQYTADINGKKYSLSTFGIESLNYFLAQDGEKGVLHIAGDPDDENTSSQEDKLRTAIKNDPDGVMEFFQGLAKDMYKRLGDQFKGTTMSSSNAIYNNKQMDTQYNRYKKELSDFEKKLEGIEDRYYKMFSKMETAMSKLNSQTSALTGLIGN